MLQKFSNNAISTLAASVDIGAQVFTLATGTGDLFPEINGDEEYFYIRLGTDENNEVVKIHNRIGDTLENYDDAPYSAAWDAGTPVALTCSAEVLESFVQVEGGGQVMVGHELCSYCESRRSANIVSGSVEFDFYRANVHYVLLTEDITNVTFTGVPSGTIACTCTLIFKQDPTGGRTIIWPASVAWPGNTAPTLSSQAGNVDIIKLLTINGGANWYCMVAGIGFGAGQVPG
jgi:hypothetical protein